jgi:phenylalanyl-tRNA synthetase beta chain
METRVKETPTVAALVSGRVMGTHWKGESPEVGFYFLKGLLEMLVREMSTVLLSYDAVKNTTLFHPQRSATLKLGLKEVGVLGEIHPAIAKNILETDEKVVVFELNLEALKRFERIGYKYKTPSKFPPVELDIALLVDGQVTSQALNDSIRQTGGPTLSNVQLFDLYEGDKIPAGKKSLAFHLTFLSNDRTLKDDEVFALRDKIVQTLKEKHSAELRA